VISLIQPERLREDQARESRGQKEFLQAILVKLQQKNKRGREFSSELQRGKRNSLEEIGKIDLSLAFEGMISHAIFHIKSLSLAFNSSSTKSSKNLNQREMNRRRFWGC
jgi:hypothetical protein